MSIKIPLMRKGLISAHARKLHVIVMNRLLSSQQGSGAGITNVQWCPQSCWILCSSCRVLFSIYVDQIRGWIFGEITARWISKFYLHFRFSSSCRVWSPGWSLDTWLPLTVLWTRRWWSVCFPTNRALALAQQMFNGLLILVEVPAAVADCYFLSLEINSEIECSLFGIRQNHYSLHL